jgi:hypothetical protein
MLRSREERQMRRQILRQAMQYAREGKEVDELQADLMDAAERDGFDISILIQLLTVLLPLILELFNRK